MDHFGIGNALYAAAEIYFCSARQTGRTTSLIESLKDGDRVIFVNSREADRVERLCLERGVKIEALTIKTNKVRDLFNSPPAKGRTIFDHSWVEEFYRRILDEASKELDHLQRETSGFDTAHFETRYKAMELAKWR